MSKHLLDVRDLSIAFRGQEVVHGATFHVDRGETVALVGESGSGKSVTALSVLQLLPYRYASHPSGSILLDGQEVVGATEDDMLSIRGNKVSMIFQEPMTSLNPLHHIERQIGEVLFVHQRLSPHEARSRSVELLERVGLRNAKDRMRSYPHQLSGGERQRVMIAMALANEPELLIADEPTTALDVTIQAQILAVLAELQREFGMAVLLITHDLGVVRKVADRVCVMKEGNLVEQGPCADVLAFPNHPYTQHLVAAEPTGEPVEAPSDSTEVMSCAELSVTFQLARGLFARKRRLRAVKDVSLRLREGHTLGVVGESGSGKTTLAMAMLRLTASQGSIHLEGRSLQELKSRQLRPLRNRFQIVFQDPYGSLPPRFTVNQCVEAGLKIHTPQSSPAQRRQLVAETLEEVGLPQSYQDRYPHELSGGERQRVAIARAIVLKPRLVVMDEPTSALDVSIQAQIVDLLRDLQRRHKLAYLFISHDLKVVRALAHEVIVMKAGQVIEQGPAERIFSDPQSDYTKTLLAAAFELEAT